jgi:hypothetical protein
MEERNESRSAASEVEQLRGLIAELYQVLGALGAPDHVLDQALAGAEGRPLPYESLLPFPR